MLEREFQYFLKHQDELVKAYSGKYVVIKGETVLGAYDTDSEAYFETEKNEEPGTFLIQLCETGTDAYTQTYHSRVAFV